MEQANSFAPLETGGILLGVADSEHVWVEEIIGPGPNAVHTRSAFEPDAAYQQTRVIAAYARSGRRIAYLGDWHTHPISSAYLSRKDLQTLRNIAMYKEARQPNPIMIVIAPATSQNGAWRFEKRAWYDLRDSVRQMRIELA